MVRAYNKDDFENKITDNLNTMLIVSENPNNKGNKHAIVKYYSFNLENINPKEGNNKDDEANFDLKEGKDIYNKENQDKRKSNNIEKSVAKKNKISIVEESENESEENVENGKLIR
ncbi:9121_t:CDS:2 [Dentiscutata erythropus]|uniref:9121_t:CDS:1 n=1 Tax=Dentiscutata erythropus TaxID=1348616 RepID=A0A9N9EC25_9GLOM|nr:9121_t:CDS:2 [Dentiscutata erythropus]